MVEKTHRSTETGPSNSAVSHLLRNIVTDIQLFLKRISVDVSGFQELVPLFQVDLEPPWVIGWVSRRSVGDIRHFNDDGRWIRRFRIFSARRDGLVAVQSQVFGRAHDDTGRRIRRQPVAIR